MSATLRRRALWSARLAVDAPLEARFPFRPPEAIERAQRRRVEAAVRHAHAHVPYYRETMRRIGLGPGELRTAADLARLPIIERDQLARDPEYFLSAAEPTGDHLALRSGGSTGEPIVVHWDRGSLVAVGAYRERVRSMVLGLAGRRVRAREVRIVSPLDASAATSRAFSASALIPQALRVKRTYLSVLDPPEINLPVVERSRPDVIATYGSYVEALFAHALATGRTAHLPKVVAYGADPLSDRMRALIADLGVEVLSVYACIEAFNIAFECDRHTGMHLNVDLVPVRVVDEEGRDIPDGASGRLVVSNLVNRGTVLLNYRLDDVAARLPGRCPCGRSLPLLSLIEGRSDEWIVPPSGRRLHPQWVRAPLSSEPGVWRYQVVQLDAGRLRIEVVAAPGVDRDALRMRLERELNSRLGEGFDLEIAYVSSLPTSPRGKVRPVMSLETRRRLEQPAP